MCGDPKVIENGMQRKGEHGEVKRGTLVVEVGLRHDVDGDDERGLTQRSLKYVAFCGHPWLEGSDGKFLPPTVQFCRHLQVRVFSLLSAASLLPGVYCQSSRVL